jgi:recombination protein RecA
MAKEIPTRDPKTLKDLDTNIKELQAKYGAGSIFIFGKNKVVVERVPIDSFYLTELLGGGYPRGRMMEIYGPESSGKTTLACYFGGQCQQHYFEDKQRHGVVAYIDMEHALDPVYASTFGLVMDDVWFSQPESAEQALNIVDNLVERDCVDLIVVDSVAALVPQKELDGEMGDATMGLMARLMSQACRKLQAKMTSKSAAIIWINQIRMKIGVFMGNPETTTGGNALKFYSAIRITTRSGASDRIEDKNDGQIGMVSKVKTIKNKVGTPFKSCEMKIIFGQGYQVDEEYLQAFVKYGIVQKTGAWYTVAMTKNKNEMTPEKTNGEEKTIDWLKLHPEIYAEYKDRLKVELSRKTTSVIVEDTEDQESVIVAEQEKLEQEEMFEDDNSAESLAEAAGNI